MSNNLYRRIELADGHVKYDPVEDITEHEIGTLQAAVENLRSADKTPERIEAAWRIAFELETMAKRLEAARRAALATLKRT